MTRYTKVGNYYVVRPQAAPASRGATWRDALEALAGLAVLGLIGFGFWLWLAIAAAVTP